MDCMEYLRTLPDNFADLAVVDPPYGIGANKMTLGNGKRKINRGNNNWDQSAPEANYFDLLKRKSKNQIMFGANHYLDNIPFLINSSCWIIWDKGTGDNDYADAELAWTSFNSVVKIFKKSWVGANAKEKNEFDRIHPTQKPIALYSWIYHNYLPNGGKVYDPMLGSGSNRIAADKAGNIDFYATEIDADYFNAQEKRWREYKAQAVITFPERIDPVQSALF